MKYSNTVEYNISTKLDSSGLTKLQSQIKQLEASMQKMSNKELIDDEKISAAKTQLEGLNAALTKSFNPSLGILDLSKFRLELESSGVSAKGLQSAFSMMGAEGKAALNGLTTQIANFNGGMERTSSTVDKIFTTFSNTFRWGMVSSFFSQFMNAIHSSVDYVKELDDSLTQIMLVTDYNKDSMNEFARSANEAAKAVSMTTTGMTNASLIFAQQGYDLNQSQELATLSAKVANASQQDTATTSDQITAYMNAYGLGDSIDELTQAMDNWALIANISAADVSELAQASQRAASMANAVGVSGETLAAQIATIESVTREAPEQIGNGLKTLYARFSDISGGGMDDDGFDLGKVTSQLESIGVKVLDQFGNIRTMDEIMENLMDVWGDLDETAKIASAQSLAGKYQVNRFMALMDNRDMYEEYVAATGKNAAGTLDMMNEEYAQSIEGRSAKLQASLEGLFSTIFNTDDIYPWMDAAQGAVDLLQQFFDALGGGKIVLLGITSLLTQVFSQNMARSINDMVANYNLGKTRQRNIDTVQDTLAAAGIDQTQGVGAYIRNTAGQAKLGALNEAEYDNYMSNVQQWADTSTKLVAAEENLIDNINATNLVYGKLTTNKNAAVLEDGTLDTSLAAMTGQGLTSDWIAQKTKSIDFSDVADEAKIAAFTLKDLQSQFDSLSLTSEQLAVPIDRASAALESLSATGGYSSNSVEKIKNELNELRTSVEQGDITFEDAQVKIQKYIGEMERLSTMASEMDGKTAGQILAEGGAGAQRSKTDYDLIQIQNESIAEKANSDQDSINLQQNIKGVLDMVAAMQQLTFAVEAFHNIGSIWSNEDLTQGEKIIQTVMNLTTVLFNATTGMKNFYDGMKGARGLFDSIRDSIAKQAEAIQQRKILEEQATQTELQNAQQKAQAEVAIAEAEKVTADTNVLKAETALQSAKANLEEAQASLTSLSADQEKINGIKLIAQAHLTAAQAAIAHAEAEGQAVNPRAEADMLEAQDSLLEIGVKQIDLDEKKANATKAVSEAEQDVLQKEKELAKAREEANIANEKFIEKQNLLAEATNKVLDVVNIAAQVNHAKSLFEDLKTVAMDALDKMGLSVEGLVTKLAKVAPVLLPLMALFGTAYGMFKDIENRKAENSQNYEEAKAQLKEVQSVTEQASSFQQQYESQKDTEQPFDGLADSAREYVQSLRDLGEEDKAQQVESATLRAELQNTEEAYQNLSDVVKETQEVLSDSTYLDMMNKAYGAISNTGESVQFLAKQEQELKDKKAELNSLAKDDPYRAELEANIAELEEFIGKNQEAFEAKDQLMSAALDYNLNQASKTNGWQLGILNTPGDDDLRAATLDWQSLNQILEESVPGFAQITDENERLALALAHTTDEAQRAAIQIQQMLNVSDNLTDDQKIGITRQLEQSDLSARQSAEVVAALQIDEESTYNNIVPELQDIIKQVNEGEDLQLVLKAKLDPEELEDVVRSQLAAWEPEGDLSKKDKAQATEDFNSIADTFFENKESLGQEGTPFEDYSEDLLENADAMEEVIEGILRYNSAIDSLDQSYDDWKEALKDTNTFSEDHYRAVTDLQEAYSDFLGLSRKVSKNFAQNADNLELMKEAAEGDAEAIEELEDAAAADIYMQVSGVDDLEVAQEKIEEIKNLLSDSGIEEIPIGEIFNLDDFPAVRQAINDELTALGLDAEEAAQYCQDVWNLDIPQNQFQVVEDDMDVAAANAETTANQVAGVVEGVTDTVIANSDYSVSSDIDSETATADDTITFTNLLPVPTGPRQIVSQIPVGDGNTGTGTGVKMEPFTANVYGVGYEPHQDTAKQFTQKTGFKEEVKAEKGDGKGHVTLPSGSTASRRPSGTTGRSGLSRPSNNGTGSSCFVAGTLITTLTGFSPIEQIKQGDIVLSYNELLHQLEYSTVVQTMVHDVVEPIYTLYIKDEKLRVTGIHRFLISHDIFHSIPQWISVADLQIGDWMLLADGTWHLIHNIEVNVEHQIVYNFEVAGNHNYYVGCNQILAHNKTGGGKSPKKTNGSGGKAKTLEKKDKEKTEKKYYEEVDKQLEHVDKTLDKVEKTADKLIGTKARAKQNEQLKLLQKELKYQQKKLDILQNQEKTDVSKAIRKADKDLEKLLKKEGSKIKITDFEYDEEGFIKNLDQVRESITKGKNSLIDRYNKIAKKKNVSEKDQEEAKRIENQIKKYDDLAKKLEENGTRYNEIILEEEEIQNGMEEIRDAMQDIAIDALAASQEALDNIKEMREEWAKFNAGIFDESKGESFLGIDNPRRKLKEVQEALKATYQMSGDEAREFYQNLITENTRLLEDANARYAAAKTKKEKESIKTEISTYEKAIAFNQVRRDEIKPGSERSLDYGVLQMAVDDLELYNNILDNWKEGSRDNPIFGDNKAALIEQAKQAEELVRKYKEEYEESIEDLKDAALDVMDDVMEQWDRQLEKFDKVNDYLDRYMDTYSLIYGDEAYDMQEALLQKQGETLQKQLEAAKNAYNQANQAYLDAEKEYIDAATGLPKEGYKDFMEHLEDARSEAEKKMRDIAAEAAEKFVDAFESAVKKSSQDILSATIGENNFDRLDRNWEWDKEQIDKYKDGVEKAYEMDKLRNRYIGMLNDAQGASLQTQNKIRAQMQEQLALLDGQKTVSEYDVKLANAKLEILQKQIALEDAQRNKNKMQLRRDTQGNYRYVYTADQGDVQQAQQDLADSEYDAYELSKQQQMSNYDDMINSYKRYISQREEIMNNHNLTNEQKLAQLQELTEKFQEYLKNAQEDFGDTTAGTLDILSWLVINGTDNTTNAAKLMLDNLLDAEGNLKEKTNVIWMDMATNLTEHVIPAIPEAISKANDEIVQKMQTTHDILVGEQGTEGLFGEVSGGANEFGKQADQASKKVDLLVTSTNNLKDALAGDSVEFQNNIAEIQQYQEELEAASNSQSVLAKDLETTRKKLETSEGLKRNYETDLNKLKSGEYVIKNGKIVDKKKWEAQQKQSAEDKKIKRSSSWSPYNDAYAIWMNGAWGGGGYWYGPYMAAGHSEAQAQAVLDLFNRGYGYSWMDTGGYTGKWGSNEGISTAKNGKLAVLHQKELVLNAQDTENILAAVSIIRKISNSMQGALNNISTASTNNISTTYSPTTEQRVEITATFPNATDADDIRQALMGLSDKAYQYAHRSI